MIRRFRLKSLYVTFLRVDLVSHDLPYTPRVAGCQAMARKHTQTVRNSRYSMFQGVNTAPQGSPPFRLPVQCPQSRNVLPPAAS